MKNEDTPNYLIIFLGSVGLFAMLYLLLSFTLNLIPSNSCDFLNPAINCSAVVTSGYSHVFGIDWYYYGIAFFSAILVLSVLGIADKKDRNRGTFSSAVLVLSVFGSFISLYLIYVELFLVHHICILCTTGHAAIFSILAVCMIRSSRLSRRSQKRA